MSWEEFVESYGFYGIWIVIGGLFLIFLMITIMSVMLIKYCLFQSREYKRKMSEERLLNTDFAKESKLNRNRATVQVCTPNGIDPNINTYLVNNDAGKDIYIRSFSISGLPRQCVFAKTFSGLFNFENCTSTIYIDRLSETEATSQLKRHIIILEGEKINAEKKGDINRYRHLQAQAQETAEWESAISRGDNTFFECAFIFTLKADDLNSLATLTDRFVAKARDRQIDITLCYGSQSEAYQSNSPLNRRFDVQWGPIKSDCAKTFYMDQKSLSTIFNYVQNELSLKNGTFLGYNAGTETICRWDPFFEGHINYNCIIAGESGSGKSTMIKTLSGRMACNTQFAAIDSQIPDGQSEGEYCNIARVLNGSVYKIRATSSEILNIYELGVTNDIVKDSLGRVVEEREILELADKLTEIENTYLMMIYGTEDDNVSSTHENRTFTSEKINDINKRLFNRCGIVDGDADSLYVYVKGVDGAMEKQRKKLPTITDFYKELLLDYRDEEDASLKKVYRVMLAALKERVRELYYSEESVKFFTREEYRNLSLKNGARYYGDEKVIAIVGSKAYYDGQSTFHIGENSRFTNLDISGLPKTEQTLGRIIAMNFISENFVKRGSLQAGKVQRKVVIYDEGHHNLRNAYARVQTAIQYRTVRKHYCSMWFVVQQLVDLQGYQEAETLIHNTVTMFLFRHHNTSKDYVQAVTKMTDAQFADLTTLGGNPKDPNDAVERKKHKGEVCVVEAGHVYFVKAAYIQSNEMIIAETDPTKIAELSRNDENARIRLSAAY